MKLTNANILFSLWNVELGMMNSKAFRLCFDGRNVFHTENKPILT